MPAAPVAVHCNLGATAGALAPASMVEQAFTGLGGVERVAVVGSWAARYQGEPGPPPRDLDVVAIGNPDRRTVRRINADLEAQLDLPV